VAHATVCIFGWWEVAKPIGGALVRCCVGFADQIVVYKVSHEHEIVGHLQWLFSTLGERGGMDVTHSRHERIYGEVAGISGNFRGIDLTKIARALEPVLRYRAKTSRTWGKG